MRLSNSFTITNRKEINYSDGTAQSNSVNTSFTAIRIA